MPTPSRHAHDYCHFSPAEYWELEALSLIKHGYLQGQMVAMAGASKAYGLITGSFSALLVNHSRGQACFVYASEMKVLYKSLLKTNPPHLPDNVLSAGFRTERL